MPRYKFSFETKELRLSNPFTISRGTKRTVDNVFLRLESGGVVGYGEAAPNTRYGENAETVTRFLEQVPGSFFEEISTPRQLPDTLDRIAGGSTSGSVQSAKAALEMCWLDWWGKNQGRPLYKLWDSSLEHPIGPVTSYTIGLDTAEMMRKKVLAASGYPILKVKLGTARDREIIRTIREVTDKPLRVDANEGWKTIEEAKSAVDFLSGLNIQLVEQPMPAGRFKDMPELKAYSPIPLCADESFEGRENLEQIVRGFDCINIKLMKSGSLIRSRQIIGRARQAGLKVMIGCMIESSLANTAGALLSLWADYADLDGHLLIADDPYRGLRLDDRKRVLIPEQPGLGVFPSGSEN